MSSGTSCRLADKLSLAIDDLHLQRFAAAPPPPLRGSKVASAEKVPVSG